jgi:hypothetical protein
MSDSGPPFRGFAPGTQPDNNTPAYRSTEFRHPTKP